ncbi:MAG: chaperonin GroEL, partial [Patescibacteria group bacterium]
AELKRVALTSFDNEEIAEMISDLYFKLGKDAVITVEKSPTMETYTETSEGIKLESGYISPYMINNPEKMETIIEKPFFLLTDYRLTQNSDIFSLMEKMSAENKSGLIVIA